MPRSSTLVQQVASGRASGRIERHFNPPFSQTHRPRARAAVTSNARAHKHAHTPAVFQPVYERAARYLDVADRTSILNSRLDVVQNLLGNLSSRLEHEHSSRLEWIIIWLIVIEVVHAYHAPLRFLLGLPLRVARSCLVGA